jgi:hypothetical protein
MGKKFNEVTAQPSTPSDTDLVLWGQAAGSGLAYKMTFTQLKAKLDAMASLTTLNTPTLTATVISATQINLSWTNVPHESSYKLEWSANGTTGWTQIGGTIAANTTSFSHTGLTASTAYYYRVSAIGDGVTYATSAFGTANGTTSAASSATYLTFPTLPTGFEAYNSAKGIRTTSGYTEAWTGILANETLAVGQRMVVKTDGIDKFSSFSVSDNTTTGSSWSAQVGGRQTDTNDGVIEGVNMNAAYNEAINNNYFYGILYEAAAVGGVGDNGILRLQKSADGTSWTTMASLTTASFTGAIYMKIFIYSASHGFSEIYKI